MKLSKLLTIAALLFSFSTAVAQTSPADKVIGIWETEAKDGKMEIFKSDNKYYGKLLWGKNAYDKDGKTPLKDINNKDPKLRDRSRVNMVFLSDLVFKDGEYSDGKVYDFNSGRAYNAKMTLVEPDKLEMRGYWGLSMLGKSGYWYRVKN